MPGEDLTVSILRSMDEITALRAEWEGLFEATSADPCASYEWFASWVSHNQPTKDVRVCVVRDSQGTVGIIPLRFRKRLAIGILPITRLTVAGSGWFNVCPALLSERTDGMSMVQAALEKLYYTDKKWSFCYMECVPRTPSMASGDGNIKSTSRVKCECQASPGSIIVELPDSVEEFRETLSGKTRRKIGQAVRGLERKGEVRLVRLGLDASPSEDKLLRLIEDTVAVSRRSWQAQRGKGQAISDPNVQGFFRDVTLSLARKGMIDLSVLYVGSEPISFDWGVTRRGRTSGLKRGFNPDFHQFGPGIVHFPRLIEDSIERGMTEIEVGSESREFKRRWGKKERDLCTVSYYSPGLRSSLIRWWRHHREQRASSDDQ